MYSMRSLVMCVLIAFAYAAPDKGTEHKIEKKPIRCHGAQPIKGYSCGRGSTGCPEHSWCHIHPSDLFAVCCPNSDKGTTDFKLV